MKKITELRFGEAPLPTATLRIDLDQNDQPIACVVLVSGVAVAAITPYELKGAAHELHDCEVRAEYKQGFPSYGQQQERTNDDKLPHDEALA